MVLCTGLKYVNLQEVWEYSGKCVSAREKVCVGGEAGVETAFILKSQEGKQSLLIDIIKEVRTQGTGGKKASCFQMAIPFIL